MSNPDGTYYYDEIKPEPESPTTDSGKEADLEHPTLHREGDLEAGKGPQKQEHSGSGVSRLLRSITWRGGRGAKQEESTTEKNELPQQPPDYNDEARKLVRSFTRVNWDSSPTQNRWAVERSTKIMIHS